MLVSRYKLSVKEEPQFAKETFEQRKERVLHTIDLITLTCVLFLLRLSRPELMLKLFRPSRIPITFTRR
jgi:hypothetical protein